ncbi:DNA cytosine methyltransferase [Antarcticibacterium flavum]|uniref:Cytosine-specific methyltransferase n=1 Tax=Antarcticibacterium flavum TaxID=2058175 RepID=A0A5B7X2V4_9FLAO|nr:MULTISPECIES: DNA cytosine methyltransferase [Antarcticibacterium]MCM4161325.1 DNA (cytosine-5-)-methyltransferase [Antarcticibacterium sp. W02-3]QCY69405.1 DNA cytosine methyltransferase [Antarcticibacterium flavum]
MKKNKIKIVGLFSGCGGLDLGFKQAGYNIIWANDILKDACDTYKLNVGNHIVNEDITKIDLKSIPPADLIIGGPPCQGFSGIGKRDPNDNRSALVYSYLDVVNKIQPKIFLFENVTGIKSSKTPDGTKVIDNLKNAFEHIGYHINIHTLNAADYGVPQKRKRVFIIGNRIGVDITAPPQTHFDSVKDKKPWITSFEAISDLESPSENGNVKYRNSPLCEYQSLMRENTNRTTLHKIPYSSPTDKEIMKHVKPGGNYMDVPDKVSTKRIMYFKSTGGRTTTYGRLDPNKPSYTLNTHFNRPNIGCNIHYEDNRMITIREGLRFQSFPDDFHLVSKTQRNFYVQVGNAVPPLLSKAWAEHLKFYLIEKRSDLAISNAKSGVEPFIK